MHRSDPGRCRGDSPEVMTSAPVRRREAAASSTLPGTAACTNSENSASEKPAAHSDHTLAGRSPHNTHRSVSGLMAGYSVGLYGRIPTWFIPGGP